MYYICEKKPQSVDTLYGIKDSKDAVVEYYTARDIIHFVKTKKLEIEGVVQDEKTGKWYITVIYPDKNEQTMIVDLEKDTTKDLDEKITLYNACRFANYVRVTTSMIVSSMHAKDSESKLAESGKELGFDPISSFSQLAKGNGSVRVKNMHFKFSEGYISNQVPEDKPFDLVCTSKNAFIYSICFKVTRPDIKKVCLNFSYLNDGSGKLDIYFTPASFVDEEWYSKVRKVILGFDSGVNVYSGNAKEVFEMIQSKVLKNKLESDEYSLMLTNDCEDMKRIRNITKLTCKLLKVDYKDAYICDKVTLSATAKKREHINLDVEGMDIKSPVRLLVGETLVLIAVPRKGKINTIGYIIGGNRVGISISSKKLTNKYIDILYRQFRYKDLCNRIKAMLAKED